MGGCVIDVIVEFLDVFAVVALKTGQPEEPLFQDRVFSVPEGEGKAEVLVDVRYTPKTVFAPAVGAGAGMVVREILPCLAALAIVLTDCTPLTLAQLWAPFFPEDLVCPVLLKPNLFGRRIVVVHFFPSCDRQYKYSKEHARLHYPGIILQFFHNDQTMRDS